MLVHKLTDELFEDDNHIDEIIFSLCSLVRLLLKFVKFFSIMLLDLNKGPSRLNKNAKIFLLRFKPSNLPTKKNK